MVIITIAIALAWAITAVILIRRNRRHTERLKFLSDAIAGGDFSFTFPEQSRWRSDRVAEQMLVSLKLHNYEPPTAENHFTIDTYDNPRCLRFLRFFVPADMDTRYGFYCFAVWK